jgi:phospholipase C
MGDRGKRVIPRTVSAAACLLAAAGPLAAAPASPRDVIKLRQAQASITHVIIIMQENRSFDDYFGTYPGAEGIPFPLCVPLDPANPSAGCVKPFHNQLDITAGGPHTARDAVADLHNGVTRALMDGFVRQQIEANKKCSDPQPEACVQAALGLAHNDVMGYLTAAEIPNYWSYAQNFVLQDHLFEGIRGWSDPSHLDLASEWSAVCTNDLLASTCTTTLTPHVATSKTTYPWVNLFQLIDLFGVSWKYYVSSGGQPDCEDDEMTCPVRPQKAVTPSVFNPAPYFASVKAGGPAYLAEHNPAITQFFTDIQGGTLPAVSWIIPSASQSEHPPNAETLGMEYVTTLVNAVMQSPYWQNTAIFIAWDDWGGFYDNVDPPNVDTNPSGSQVQGFGLRVPGLLVSAYANPGMIDHSVLSLDSYATFIENLFLGGTRLNPTALGNPDSRPDIRDALTSVTYLNGNTAPIGDLLNEFDFTQTPLPPLILPMDIPTTLLASCGASVSNTQCQSAVVSLRWDTLTSAQGAVPFTYHIVRDDPAVEVCKTTATKCTDTPGSGTHLYRAYSVDANGLPSPLSAAAEVDEP